MRYDARWLRLLKKEKRSPKKTPLFWGGVFENRFFWEMSRLTFAELWCAACSLETWLFAFFDAGIAGEETGFFQGQT